MGRKKEKSEGVSGMVHEFLAGVRHFGLQVADGCLGLLTGRVALALAVGGAELGRDRDRRGDFMDQAVYQ